MDSLNSCIVVELGLDKIPSTSGGDSQMLLLPSPKMNSFHAIFDLNGVLITTHFNKGGYGKVASHTIILWPILKEFLEKCLMQFHIYIWSTTQHHNIYNYLDQIWHKTQIFIHVFRVLDQTFCM